ncbi:hypothetical protein E8E13_001477 [Curvularia kusanoi]|uniref:C6 transcription factor n=1 Tax=Curvularia kusanoi TaxID=90978 RepID=A0A9P4T402_CURKU|nr:hypothetical protein E8E13_001477 [Curvularia kusanoi]
MAEAQECIHSAESTIQIVYAVMEADATSTNNLGVWFFTLYYVFTASLVVSGRLLWARHGSGTADESAVAHSISLLEKAQTIFQNLNRHSALVSGCSRYVRRLTDMICQATMTRATSHGASPPGSGSQFGNLATSAPSPFDSMRIDAEGLEAFGFLTSDMFDPLTFDNLGMAFTGISPPNPVYDEVLSGI